MSTLAVAEIFTTWQGEGPRTGRRATFLRLGGCNLTCTWCDTPYTWDSGRYDLRAEIKRMPVADVAQSVDREPLLVITGGEPLLQANAIGELLTWLPEQTVEVETNGTVPVPDWADTVEFNVSPKLANSGAVSYLHPSWWGVPARFKFVVTDVDDVHQAARWNTPPRDTWIMPEGTDPATIIFRAAEIADTVAEYGFNLTLRQHVLLWGNERGR